MKSWKLLIFGAIALTLLGLGWGTAATTVSAAAGDIIISKTATGPSAGTQSFSYTFAGGCGANFSLGNAGAYGVNCPAGAYSVTEAVVAGWTLTGISCASVGAGESYVVSLAARSVSITHVATGQTSCTFSNMETLAAGNITIQKQAYGSSGYPFPFSITGASPCNTSFSLVDGGSQPFSCSPGSYTVSESVPPGWVLQSITCVATGGASYVRTSVSVAITMVSGGSVSCVFYDVPVQQQQQISNNNITITKTAVGAGSTAFSFNISGSSPCNQSFSLTNGGSRSFSCGAGTYTVTENVPVGWMVSSITCTNSNGTNYTSNSYGNSVSISVNSYYNYNNNQYPYNQYPYNQYPYNGSYYDSGSVTCNFTNVPTYVASTISIAVAGSVACNQSTPVTVTVRNSSGNVVPDGTAVTVSTNPVIISNTYYTVGGNVSFNLAPSAAGNVTITANSGGATQTAVVSVTCNAPAQVIVQAPPTVIVAAAAPAPAPAPVPVFIPQVAPPKAGSAGLFGVVDQSDWRIFLGILLVSALSALSMVRARARSES